MLFTPLWFWSLRRELEDRLAGGSVIGGQVLPSGLRITLETADEPQDLVFWLDPLFARAEFIRSRRVRTLKDPWTALLNCTLRKVTQPDYDRRLTFDFAKGAQRFSLDFLAFAQPVLTLRQEGEKPEDLAAVGPGKARAFAVTRPFVLEMKSLPVPDVDSAEALVRTVRGLDGLWLEAALSTASEGATEDQRLKTAWAFIQSRIHELSHQPKQSGYIVSRDDQPVAVSVIDLSFALINTRFDRFDTLSEAAGRFVHARRADIELDVSRKRHLLRAREIRSRLKRRLTQLVNDRQKQQDHAIWTENADWLTAQLGQIKKGAATLEIPTADGMRSVSLDPALKPHAQANRWYHKARRLKRGLAVTESHIQKTEVELGSLEQLILQVEQPADGQGTELDTAWNALAKRVERAPAKQSIRLPAAATPFRRFRSPAGLAIWVGRNNKENDELTLHQAHKHDLWFHAQQTPGSHVVLRSHMLPQAPAMADVVAAAKTAAYYSKARTSKKVPVIYTEARYVRKPRKAPPGQVAVEREKSVMVEPSLPPRWDE